MTVKAEFLRDGRSPIPKNERISRTMSRIRGKNTKPEIALRKELWRLGVKGYRLHWKKAPGRPDIVFVAIKLAVFVNGCFWHRCPHCQPPEPKTHSAFWKEKFDKNVARDLRKAHELKKEGWSVITLWECRLKRNVEVEARKVQRARARLSSR